MTIVAWMLAAVVLIEVVGNLALLANHLRARRKTEGATAPWGMGANNAYAVLSDFMAFGASVHSHVLCRCLSRCQQGDRPPC